MSSFTSRPTAAIAQFVAETHGDAIPAVVRERATLTLIDTYGTTIAGISDDAPRVIRDSLLPWSAPGPSVVAGLPDRRTDPATAALLNAAAAHTLDYDSISFAVSGFIGSATACALAALADASDTAPLGYDVLTAYCLGWEGAAALSRGINPLHYSKGWHPTSTMGGFAATLAACRFLGLDAEATATAIGIAVSEASGVKTMIGNMINAWHVGTGARNGVIAAQLASQGFAAHPAALEADQGFLNLFNGPGNYDIDAIVSSLGVKWDLLDPGPIFKVYPCCGLIHSALDAVLALRTENGIDASEVRSVEVLVHEFVPRVMHIEVPESGYAAKFSIPYCIATGLIDGSVDLSSFAAVRPEVVELGRRVNYGVHPDLHGGETFLEAEFTDVKLETDRGVFEARVDRMTNRGTASNLVIEDLEAKLTNCISHGAIDLDASMVWRRLGSIDENRAWTYWGEGNGA